MPAVPELRLALVVPGAASLGAYEAGALTALLRIVRASGGRVVVDTIVGASAGPVGGAVLGPARRRGLRGAVRAARARGRLPAGPAPPPARRGPARRDLPGRRCRVLVHRRRHRRKRADRRRPRRGLRPGVDRPRPPGPVPGAA